MQIYSFIPEPTSKAIMDSKRNAEEIKIESLLSSTDDSSNRPLSGKLVLIYVIKFWL